MATTIALGLTPKKFAEELKKNRKLWKEYGNWIDSTINHYKKVDGDKAGFFLDTPVSEYTDYEKELADLNPGLFDVSKRIDTARQKMNDLKRQEINLMEAQKQMYEPLNNAEDYTADSANKQIQSIANKEENQIAAAQGMAGKAGATTGMLSNIESQVSNQFAPQKLQAQAQAENTLSNLAAQKSNIPGKLSAINAQDITNKYNKLKMDYQKKVNANYGKKTSSSLSSKDIINLYDQIKGGGTKGSTNNSKKPTEGKDNKNDASGKFVDDNGETALQEYVGNPNNQKEINRRYQETLKKKLNNITPK